MGGGNTRVSTYHSHCSRSSRIFTILGRTNLQAFHRFVFMALVLLRQTGLPWGRWISRVAKCCAFSRRNHTPTSTARYSDLLCARIRGRRVTHTRWTMNGTCERRTWVVQSANILLSEDHHKRLLF